MVRPHLEYGNIIWYPLFKRQSAMLERVQRRATKMLIELNDLSYQDRLKRLHLPSLKARRVRGDLIQTYKIMSNIDNINFTKFFQVNYTAKTRNATNKFFVQYSQTNIRKHTFGNRVVPLWNSLTNEIINAPNLILNTFKNLLDDHKFFKDIYAMTV